MNLSLSSLGHGVPTALPFSKRDLRLPLAIRAGRRNSISGVQSKVLLSLFRDPEFMTKEFETLGFYSFPDFIILGRAYGVGETGVVKLLDEFRRKATAVEEFVRCSYQTADAQLEYLRIFQDRLRMFR